MIMISAVLLNKQQIWCGGADLHC